MEILNLNGGKSFFAAGFVFVLSAMTSALVSPIAMAQSNRDFQHDQIAVSKEQIPPLTISLVTINGQALPGVSKEALRLPANAGTISFSYGPTPPASNAPAFAALASAVIHARARS